MELLNNYLFISILGQYQRYDEESGSTSIELSGQVYIFLWNKRLVLLGIIFYNFIYKYYSLRN